MLIDRLRAAQGKPAAVEQQPSAGHELGELEEDDIPTEEVEKKADKPTSTEITQEERDSRDRTWENIRQKLEADGELDPKGRWVKTDTVLTPEQRKYLLGLQVDVAAKRWAAGKRIEKRAVEDAKLASEYTEKGKGREKSYDGQSVNMYFGGREQKMKVVEDLEGDGYFLISAEGLKAKKSASSLVEAGLARRASKEEVEYALSAMAA